MSNNISLITNTLTTLRSNLLTGEYWGGARTAVIKLDGKHLVELRHRDLKSLHEITGAILEKMPAEPPESQADPLAASLGG